MSYVDVQRNMAVALGERDVKADVKAKNKYNDNPARLILSLLFHRRDRRGAAILMDGDTADADAYLAQVGSIFF